MKHLPYNQLFDLLNIAVLEKRYLQNTKYQPMFSLHNRLSTYKLDWCLVPVQTILEELSRKQRRYKDSDIVQYVKDSAPFFIRHTDSAKEYEKYVTTKYHKILARHLSQIILEARKELARRNSKG